MQTDTFYVYCRFKLTLLSLAGIFRVRSCFPFEPLAITYIDEPCHSHNVLMARPLVSRLTSARPYVCRNCASQLLLPRTAEKEFSTSRRLRQATEDGSVLELLEARGYIKEIAGYVVARISSGGLQLIAFVAIVMPSTSSSERDKSASMPASIPQLPPST